MQEKALIVVNGHPLPRDTLERMLALAKMRGVIVGADVGPVDGEPVKTPLATRIAKSKFNALLDDMSDDQLKATAIALMFDTKVQEAVKAYHKSVAHYAQAAAIAYQLDRRGIKLS